MFFILLIIFLISSTESMIAAVSPTKTQHNILYRKTKHTLTTFSARLIHRSSPDSPYYNPNYTRNDHIKDSVRTSIAKNHYFGQIKARSATNYVAAPIHGFMFCMHFAMGTPPVHRYGVLDTGSAFTWFQCLPCIHCCKQEDYPMYNPKKSTSYQQVLCNTYQCSIAPVPSCKEVDSTMVCHFFIRYFDGAVTRGIVSTDTLTLSADNMTETLKDAVFGCANDRQDNNEIPGIVGLKNHASSLHRQLGLFHFSYYIFINATDLFGEAHFGPGASLSSTGANTPLLPSRDGLYYLNLTGISVDGLDLDLPSDYFDKDGYNDGVIIDSGTSFSSLPTKAFEKLKEAVADEMYMYTQGESDDKDFELCYKDYKVNEGEAPEVVFHFSGLDFTVCNSNLWVWDSTSELACLAILRNNHGMGVIGIYQQRNVQVGYDLEKNLLTLNSPEVCPDQVIDFIN